MPRRDPIETKVQDVFNSWEIARSRLSQHELQHLEDIRLKDSTDVDVIIKETAQDKEDKWLKERSTFEFGAYDERLTKIQYLFVKQKFPNESEGRWLLPFALFDSQQDQHLLDTARRALKESLNIFNGYKIVSKVPSAVYTYKYPKSIAKLTNHGGAKVFFLKAHLDSPSPAVLEAVDSSKSSDRLQWLTRDEAVDCIDKKYLSSLSQGLLHERRVDIERVLHKASIYATTKQNSRLNRLQQAN